MKTKLNIFIVLVIAAILSSCTDFLTPNPLATVKLKDYFAADSAGIAAVNATYVPLQWQYGSNGLTYGNEWFIGDVVSDDALKGGGGTVTSDMNTVYQLENFQSGANNNYLETLYYINYQGIFRANFAIENIKNSMKDSPLKTRLLGEAKFLRAFYHFRLMRVFGGVVKGDRTFDQNDILMARNSKEEIDKFIRQDFEDAIKVLPMKSEYALTEKGRATKGTAQAMLMRTILFDINEPFVTDKVADYKHVMELGDSIITTNEYSLKTKYQDFFKTFVNIPATVAKFVEENGDESVFEIQYISESTSDWGGGAGGLGMSRGNYDPLVTRSRGTGLAGPASSQTGYGFNHPTQDLYNEFETGDLRRDEAILPYDSTDVYGSETEHHYMNGYHSRKTTLGFWYPYKKTQIFINPTFYAMRSPGNTFVIRYSDVLLMYAEAACERGGTYLSAGVDKLNLVRKRAKDSSANPTDAVTLMPFPYGSYANNQTDLRTAIRHERRVEFAMEGQRWWDLVRWRTAEQVMNAYRANPKYPEAKDMSPFDPSKHYLFPIPETQLNANPLLKQNPGY